ncbi:ankyrin repeat domain-containing protein [Gammaproteobacteria bacterium]|nr:ankyrin repeat domain-containing protein [Gammaproteobacteria bacterium]
MKAIHQKGLVLVLSSLLTGLTAISTHAQLSLPEAAMAQDSGLLKQLLAQGADPNITGQFDTPALHWLIRVNDQENVLLLLSAGADVNQTNRYGVTPMSLAVSNGDPDMVRLLLDAGADPNTLEHNAQSVLMSAADVGNFATVKLLVENGADVNARDRSFGQTPLMFAARAGHPLIVDYLLEKGTDPNAATTIGKTPPWVGPNSQRGFGFGIGIIRGGTPADRGRREPIPGGMTPLLYAARQGHTDIAKLLLEAGADIHKAEANNISPLLMAVETNSMETAHYLIAQGADVNSVDWYGRTPLWEAVNVRNLYIHNDKFSNYIANRDEIFNLIETLIKEGADLNARTKESPPIRYDLLSITGTLEWVDFTGQTAFLRAARAGDMDVMNLLLENGADPYIETFAGTNALMAAAGINWVVAQTWTESAEQLLAAVQFCIDLGMDINHANSMGLAAIHGAANRGSNDIIQLLVDHGARLDVVDNEDRSPLVWARGVFLATHPSEEKPESMALISSLLEEQGLPVR